VVCSSQSCDHSVCVKERGICFDCASEKLGVFVTSPPVLSIVDSYVENDRETWGFDDAIRLIEDVG